MFPPVVTLTGPAVGEGVRRASRLAGTSAMNVSRGDGVSGGQPALSPDRRLVAFVRLAR